MAATNDFDNLIDNYRPAPNGPAATLSEADISVVRAAVRTTVRLMAPRSKGQVSLLLTHTARHVTLAVERGVAVEMEALFSPVEVRRSVDTVAAGGVQASPFRSNLERVARAVAPSTGHPTALRVKAPGVLEPYCQQEQVQLEAVSRGMKAETGASYRRGLALGFGAGLEAGDANATRGADVVAIAGGAILRVPSDGRFVGVPSHWAGALLDVHDPDARLTDSYDRIGRQRRQRALSEATGRPDYSSDRLRASWICGLLSRDVPVAVIAKAAGLGASTLRNYLPFVPPVEEAVAARWLSGEFEARPDREVTLPDGFAARLRPAAVPAPLRDIEDVIATFAPASSRVAEVWGRDVVREIEDLVRRETADPKRARQLLSAASRHLEWAIVTGGVPLTVAALFKDSTVDRATASVEMSCASTPTMRSRLRALSVVAELRSPPTASSTIRHASPYGEEDLERLVAVLPSLGERERRYLESALALGLGVGASHRESIEVRGDDIIDRGTLAVRLGDRTVFAATAYTEELRRMRGLGDERLIGESSRALKRVRQRVDEAVGFPVVLSRLRATWLVRNLQLGVPLRVLGPAAGTRLLELSHLVSTYISVSDAEVVSWTLSSSESVPG